MSNISRSTVTIRFSGKSLDPENFNLLLDCLPTRAGKTGEMIVTKSGNSRKVTKGFWHLEYGESDDVDLEEKVRILLGKLTNDLTIWQEFSQKYHADVFCGVFLDNMNEGFMLSPGIMKELANRQIEIGFDIYSP
jgi:hypothetical protein